eukprot:scaffold36298_cov122-Isochrysis_galbana.AAC.10
MGEGKESVRTAKGQRVSRRDAAREGGGVTGRHWTEVSRRVAASVESGGGPGDGGVGHLLAGPYSGELWGTPTSSSFDMLTSSSK